MTKLNPKVSGTLAIVCACAMPLLLVLEFVGHIASPALIVVRMAASVAAVLFSGDRARGFNGWTIFLIFCVLELIASWGLLLVRGA